LPFVTDGGKMKIKRYDIELSVCQISSVADVDFTQPLTFVSKTADELFWVCPNHLFPSKRLSVMMAGKSFGLKDNLILA